ncbi:MAG TPA: PEGA domain-containing protein, partial [Vicinamibacterales bacterium]|nr:PEGA domain-containing protein [Vicinamibacterales bacterium]
DAALDALASLETAPPSDIRAALPEWRLLADPVGANAPTIDVVGPLESLDELVAEFAATAMISPTPTPAVGLPVPVEEEPTTGIEPPAIPAEPPVAMLEAPLPLFEAPVEFTTTAATRQAETEVPYVVQPSVLDEILNLQESQAAAQAEIEPRPEAADAAPDIAAWSFVEELLHHDARFEAHADAADTADVPAPEADASADTPLPPLPPDWFVDVRPAPAPPAPLLASPVEPEVLVEQWPEDVPEEMPRPLPPARPVEPPRVEAMPAAIRFESPSGIRPEPEAPEEDQSGPVFPRVAPSVRRVRAEARRRRIARLRSGSAEILESFIGACSSATGALAGGLWHAVSAVGRGSATAGRSVLSVAVLLITAFTRGAGGAARAVAAGVGGAVRAVAAGAGAVASGGARATSQLAHAAGTAFKTVIAGTGAVIRLLASATLAAAGQGSRAAAAIVQAGAGALSAAARALAAGLGMFGRASRAGAAAGLRGVGQAVRGCTAAACAVARGTASSAARAGRAAGRATATAASAAAAFGGTAGRTAASAGAVIARAAVAIPRKAYFLASDLADRVPKPAFRPWYLAAALVVIAAVAGVPYARARLFTEKPAESSIRVEPAVPDVLPKAAGADLKGTGSIRVTTEPAGADVLIDGVLHGSAPLTVENLAEGAHTILVRDGTGSVRKTVQVRADEAVEAALQLRPGWLAVFAPVKLEILENGRSIGSTERGRILTPPGPHTIELVSQAMGFRETRQVEIKPGVVAAVTIAMPPATIEIVAPADAEILVDGERIGTAPLGPVQVAVGTREILMRHATLGERRQTVSVTYLSPTRVVFE